MFVIGLYKTVRDLAALCCSSPKDSETLESLENLPVEIWSMCLRQLEPIELVKVQRVCRKWRVLATDPLIWQLVAKRLNLSVQNNNFDSICLIEQVLEQLKDVLDKDLISLIRYLPHWNGLNAEQISLQYFHSAFQDRKSHAFKAFYQGDLVLILLKEDRNYSRLIWINGKLNLDKQDKTQWLYRDYFDCNKAAIFEFELTTPTEKLSQFNVRCNLLNAKLKQALPKPEQA